MEDITAQAEKVFTNLRVVVEDAGGTLEDLVSTTTYLAGASTRPSVRCVVGTSPGRSRPPRHVIPSGREPPVGERDEMTPDTGGRRSNVAG